MEFVVLLGIGALGLYLYLRYRRAQAFLLHVAKLVETSLKDKGAPEEAIRAYLNSTAFIRMTSGVFGKQNVYRVAAIALKNFESNPAKWQQTAASRPLEAE